MEKSNYNFVSKNRRPVEDKRFVTGHGNFVADIDRPDMLHVAILACHEPSASIDEIDFSAALKMKGVIDVITGKELASATKPLMNGLDTPNVKRYSLAFEKVRYAGEWVCAIVAKSRAIAEDAAEKILVKTTSLNLFLILKKRYYPKAQ
jgi:Aerobic-type carbon monoxide dehydrogenase, large subunit CoxL/CutL homologs